jgi:hypothetical protein
MLLLKFIYLPFSLYVVKAAIIIVKARRRRRRKTPVQVEH